MVWRCGMRWMCDLCGGVRWPVKWWWTWLGTCDVLREVNYSHIIMYLYLILFSVVCTT